MIESFFEFLDGTGPKRTSANSNPRPHSTPNYNPTQTTKLSGYGDKGYGSAPYNGEKR